MTRTTSPRIAPAPVMTPRAGGGSIACAMTRPLILCLLILCLAVPARAAPFDDAREVYLANGLRVVVLEARQAPAAHLMLWIPAGAADEFAGAHGAAHVLEHLMFKGGGGLAPGEYSRRVRAMGGQENAFTGQDYTAYHMTVPATHWREALALEAQRITGTFDVPQDEAAREVEVVRAERAQRTESDPAALLYEGVRAALFADHPYGRPVIGMPEDLAAMDLERAARFRGFYYRPNGATLILSGDVSAKQATKAAREAFGPWGAGEPADGPPSRAARAPCPGDDPPPEPAYGTTVELSHPAVRQPLFLRMWRVPARRGDAAASYALEVAATALGDGPTSHLYRRLVVEQRVASALEVSYSPHAWDDATMTLAAWPAPGVTPGALAAALDAALADFALEPPALDSARTRLVAAVTYAQDSLTGPASWAGQALSTGTKLAAVQAWPERIADVDAAAVDAAVARHLSGPDSRFVDGVLLPYSAPAQRGTTDG
jgi:zinc protease